MELNCDLHIHGRYSGGASRTMDLGAVARAAGKKGLGLVGTGDALNDNWIRDLEGAVRVDDGTFEMEGMRLVLTTEVEDAHRVHHLLIFPSMASRDRFKQLVSGASVNIDTDGRPNLRLTGDEIVEHAKEAEALVGPCHAFTPWTSIYSRHDSLEECYGDHVNELDFLELGLSADTEMADRVQSHHPLTFLSNSDAHSASPHRIGREYNVLKVEDATYTELALALARRNGRGPVMNVGLPPQEGKYHLTACISCYSHFTLDEAIGLRWKCPHCGKRIKKGVRDRIEELARLDGPASGSPDHRPPYRYTLPLGMVIARMFGVASESSVRVMRAYTALTEQIGSETSILFEAKLDRIEDVAGEDVRWGVEAFRKGYVQYIPGGGGKYGQIIIPDRDGNLPHMPGKGGAAQARLGDF